METTICSSMHCYKRAAITGIPGKPPFCPDCIKKQEERKEETPKKVV